MSDSQSGDFGFTRQKTIDVLCEHFANDALTVEDFEARVDLAHKAESAQELRELLKDLPTGDLPIPREEIPDELTPRVEASIPSTRVKERGYLVAALGGVNRTGRWIPARQNFALAMLGGMKLDFREALLPPGVTDVWIFAFMGGTEIVVPPGLTVECDGVAILGGFEHREEAFRNRDPNAPVLRIRGFAALGGVDVAVRHPGESERDAKRRRKAERREQRRLEKERRRLEKG